MLIPVRCFTCGKPIGHLQEDFNRLVAKYNNTDAYTSKLKAFEKLGIEKYCCRIALFTYPDIVDTILKYSSFKKEYYMQTYDEPEEEIKKDILCLKEPCNDSEEESEADKFDVEPKENSDETDSETEEKKKLIVEEGEEDEEEVDEDEEEADEDEEADEEEAEEDEKETEDEKAEEDEKETEDEKAEEDEKETEDEEEADEWEKD